MRPLSAHRQRCLRWIVWKGRGADLPLRTSLLPRFGSVASLPRSVWKLAPRPMRGFLTRPGFEAATDTQNPREGGPRGGNLGYVWEALPMDWFWATDQDYLQVNSSRFSGGVDWLAAALRIHEIKYDGFRFVARCRAAGFEWPINASKKNASGGGWFRALWSALARPAVL